MSDMTIRPAQPEEIPELEKLIELSTRALSTRENTPEEIEASVKYIFGVDTQVVADHTYFVVEKSDRIAACGGWSQRKTLFGADRFSPHKPELLNPATDPAKIRAFFVHPDFARQGIGATLLAHCEAEARRHGFSAAELMSTLPGVAFYQAHGYIPGEQLLYDQPDGTRVRFVPMRKSL